MISSDNCFKEIGKSFSLVKYFNENINHLVFDDYFGFKLSPIEMKLILSEPLLHSIDKKYKIRHGGILRLDPFRCYKWHKDTVRGVSVNMLLNTEINSITLFGVETQDSVDQYEILKFEYKPETFYLFNTQIMHTVINFESPRYLFTIEFESDKNILDYNNLLL